MISKLIGQQHSGESFTRAMEVGVGWVSLDLNVPLLVTCTAECKGLIKNKAYRNKVTRIVEVVLQF